MRVYLCLVAVAAVFSDAHAGALPSFIKPCSKSDPNLNQCIEKTIALVGPTFAKGIPELGVKSLDPVDLGKIVVNNPSLKLTFDDTVVTGLGGFKINHYKVNLGKQKALLDFTANVTLKAHYVMDGKVLILPIQGDGQTKIVITNLNIIIKYEYDSVDGYWKVKSHKDEYKMDKAHFKFTNLFNGNKDLAKIIDAVINEHWESVMRDIAPVAFQTIITACVNEVKKLFAAVPEDQLLLP